MYDLPHRGELALALVGWQPVGGELETRFHQCDEEKVSGQAMTEPINRLLNAQFVSLEMHSQHVLIASQGRGNRARCLVNQ